MQRALQTFTLVYFLLTAAYAEAATIQSILVGFEENVRPLVVVGLGAAVAVFVWGGVLFVAQAGDEKAREKGRARMVWGVVGLLLIVGVWGVVEILRTTIGVGSITDCAAPRIDKDGVVNCFE